ncbi:sulfatase [Halostagnicola kamekurae]|uniref:Arylsulfatase A n=1 Tax=Halostagnicola kamekurae TaxID=619731 RepID=A0A1I6PRX8_9EURY|nr:sulfatase [Halostagnicola kamekurae]SFS42795.1 Arylsulfatase A [Halostagnicola kamekurae]
MDSLTRSEPEPHECPRNVVFVVLDTARATSVSDRTMPALSRLATAGTAFENAFATAPWTLPSHASMFTGTYPSEHGTHGHHPFLDESLRTLPEVFADAGYETVGVSNNTWITEEFGFDRGLDHLRRGWQYVQSEHDMGAVVRGEDLREKLEATRENLFHGNPLVNATNILYSEVLQPAGDDGADRTTTWVENWLEGRDDDSPFFLFCNYIEPHVVYDPPRELAERHLPEGASYEAATAVRQDPRAYDCEDYEIDDREFAMLRGLYRAELAYVDRQIARLRRALEETGEWEETLLVVCGDHGEHVGEHDFFGHQYNLYDTLLHVPLVIHGGEFTGGGTRRDLVQLLDLPETLFEATGIEDPAFAEQSQGRSMHPTSDTGTRDAIFAEYVAPQPSIDRLDARFGDVPDRVRAFDRRLQAIRTHDAKYVRGDDGFERFHDLEMDPHEQRNLCAEPDADSRNGQQRDRREALIRRLDERLGDLESVVSETGTESVSMRAGTKERLADLGYL